MILPENFRSWLQKPLEPPAENKLDWSGIILTVGTFAVFTVGVIIFMFEMDSSSGMFFEPHITQFGLLKKYPQKIFLLTPLAAFYAILRRKKCRTNGGCLKCYAVIGLLIVFSVLAVYWEILACRAEWGDMCWLWEGAA